jgi:hypothetical protein
MRIRLLEKFFSAVDFERWDHVCLRQEGLFGTFWSAAGERRAK